MKTCQVNITRGSPRLAWIKERDCVRQNAVRVSLFFYHGISPKCPNFFGIQKGTVRIHMKYYLTEKEDVIASLQTSSETGLSTEEAAARLERDGKNKLAEGKKVTLLQRIISQILDPMVLVLIGAAIVSAVTELSLHPDKLPTDVFIILAVVIRKRLSMP